MTACPRPSPQEQLEFLQRIQRLFEDASFSATYKYALLIALAELAVEHGSNDGSTLTLGLDLISEKFAELYWPQILPYSSGIIGATTGILTQNQGSQAGVVNALLILRKAGANTIAQAKLLPTWPDITRKIANIMRQMPIKYLQNVGGTTIPFIYEYPLPQGQIILKPGAAYCLRLFQGLILQLARNGWMNHVRQNRLNAPIIGQAGDMEAFMFGTPRQNLAAVAGTLIKLQDRRCFYCEERIYDSGDVDHFIPWSKYPRDLAHNFVLAHVKCNRRKSDMLAARRHLDHWLNRNQRYSPELSGALGEAGFLADARCSTTVARWAYDQAVNTCGIAWIEEKLTEPVTAGYLESFLAIP